VNCPRCEKVLQEREREGLTIDVCPSCRGIWLDRGELEKLIARATQDFDGEQAATAGSPMPHTVRTRADYDDDDDDDDDLRRRQHDDDDDDLRRRQQGVPGAPKRKRRWYESIGDIFD
jgi:uncharacterized protein